VLSLLEKHHRTDRKRKWRKEAKLQYAG